MKLFLQAPFIVIFMIALLFWSVTAFTPASAKTVSHAATITIAMSQKADNYQYYFRPTSVTCIKPCTLKFINRTNTQLKLTSMPNVSMTIGFALIRPNKSVKWANSQTTVIQAFSKQLQTNSYACWVTVI